MKLTEGGRLERPNICWLCERTPDIGMPVIDTEKYFDGWPYNLQGRRYVCERCIKEMLKFFGFAEDDAIIQAQIAQLRAEGVVRGVKQRLDTLVFELAHLADDPSTVMVMDDVLDEGEAEVAIESDGGSPEAAVAGEATDEPVVAGTSASTS